MEEAINACKTKVVNNFVAKGVVGSCLISSIMLKELLDKNNINTTLKQGFAISHKYHISTMHFYLETDDGITIDAAMEISNTLVPQLETCEWVLSTYSPGGYRRVDCETSEEQCTLDDLMKAFNAYQTNPKLYWKDAPLQALKLRKQLMKSKNKVVHTYVHSKRLVINFNYFY